MKVSSFDFNHAKALHHLLEEAHVGRAAVRLGITPAAASNALRRLRDELGDQLLVKKGRGLVRTRAGEELRGAAREVMESAERLLGVARPFDAATYQGALTIALSDHVAAILLPDLDRLAREHAPRAVLAIAPVPAGVSEWLEKTGGVLVSPAGAFAAIDPGENLACKDFYQDGYVCIMRHGHPAARRRWNVASYAGLGHVLVTPRGRTQRSDIDEQLESLGHQRHIERIVPSFSLALPLVSRTDVIVTMPARCARTLPAKSFLRRQLPFELRPLDMRMVSHPVHASDARTQFVRKLLLLALQAVDDRKIT